MDFESKDPGSNPGGTSTLTESFGSTLSSLRPVRQCVSIKLPQMAATNGLEPSWRNHYCFKSGQMLRANAPIVGSLVVFDTVHYARKRAAFVHALLLQRQIQVDMDVVQRVSHYIRVFGRMTYKGLQICGDFRFLYCSVSELRNGGTSFQRVAVAGLRPVRDVLLVRDFVRDYNVFCAKKRALTKGTLVRVNTPRQKAGKGPVYARVCNVNRTTVDARICSGQGVYYDVACDSWPTPGVCYRFNIHNVDIVPNSDKDLLRDARKWELRFEKALAFACKHFGAGAKHYNTHYALEPLIAQMYYNEQLQSQLEELQGHVHKKQRV